MGEWINAYEVNYATNIVKMASVQTINPALVNFFSNKLFDIRRNYLLSSDFEMCLFSSFLSQKNSRGYKFVEIFF